VSVRDNGGSPDSKAVRDESLREAANSGQDDPYNAVPLSPTILIYYKMIIPALSNSNFRKAQKGRKSIDLPNPGDKNQKYFLPQHWKRLNTISPAS
jgi:hypothetical protein